MPKVARHLTFLSILSLEPSVSKTQPAHMRIFAGNHRVFDERRSSCLWLQLLSVEIHSFLPDDQRDGCNLACQGRTRHGRLPSLDQQTLVEIVEWPSADAGLCCRSLENILKIVVAIPVESTKSVRFLRTS